MQQFAKQVKGRDVRTIVAGLIVALTMANCVRIAETTQPFDPGQAEFINGSGSNTITGQAFLRQAGGAVVTCAGSEVFLIPRTDYAVERMLNLYGKTENAARSLPRVKADEADPEYIRLSRSTICDAEGDFEFSSVPDGEYFVTTGVFWSINQYARAGGNLMHPAKVTGGESVRLLMSP